MKLTTYDKPIGQARPSQRFAGEPSIRDLCRRAGLHPNAAYKFRERHPECADWSHQQVIEQMLANRDQSAVARRQVCRGRKGFAGIRYA